MRIEPGGRVQPGRKARALLFYLLSARKPVERGRLAGLLWSERGEAQAHASLRQCLHELRDLAGTEPPVLTVDRHFVAVDAARVPTEIDDIELLASAGHARQVAALVPASSEPLLDGFDGIDPAFDEWLTIERAAWQDRILRSGLACAADALARGDADAARELAARLRQFDPVNESAARLEMEAASRCGDRDGVRRVWRRLEAALASELDATPSEETIQLYRRLVVAQPSDSAGPATPETSAETESDRVTQPSNAADAPETVSDPSAAQAPLEPEIAGQAPVAPDPADPARSEAARRGLGWRALAAAGALAVALSAGAIVASRINDRPGMSVAFEPSRSNLVVDGTETFDNAVSTHFAALAAAQGGHIGLAGGGFGLEQADSPAFRVKTSLIREGRTLTAAVQLLSPDDGTVLWSGRYANVSEQSGRLALKIAGDLTNALRCAVEPSPETMVSGREKWLRLAFAVCREQDSSRGVALAEQLVRDYPEQAVGWSLLAKYEMFLVEVEAFPTARFDPKRVASARRHAFKALALNPRSQGAYIALAHSLREPYRLDRQLRVIEAGLRANPDSPTLHSLLGISLFLAGYTKTALAATQHSARIDPVSPYVRSALVRRLIAADQVELAFVAQTEGEEIDPDSEVLREQRLRMMGERGDPKAAMALYREKSRAYGYPPPMVPLWLQVLEWRISPARLDIAGMERTAAWEIAREPDTLYFVAAQFARIGEIDRALAYLDRAPLSQTGSHSILFYSDLAPLRRDPRFFALMHRLGLVGVWQRRGQWPDFCSEPGLAYDCKAEAGRLEAAAAL